MINKYDDAKELLKLPFLVRTGKNIISTLELRTENKTTKVLDAPVLNIALSLLLAILNQLDFTWLILYIVSFRRGNTLLIILVKTMRDQFLRRRNFMNFVVYEGMRFRLKNYKMIFWKLKLKSNEKKK